MRLSRPRLTPLPPSEWNDEQRELLTRGNPPRVLNVFATLVRHQDLYRRWMPFANHVLFKSSLPERERELVRMVMVQERDPGWDPERGVVHRRGATRYRVGVVADEPEAMGDPDVRFYAERNPGQEQGDTLVALCPLSLRNLWSMVGKAMARRRRRAAAGPGREASGGGA